VNATGKIRSVPSGDLFYPYLHRIPAITEICDERETEGIVITRFRFNSKEGCFDSARTRRSEVYAVMAQPASVTGHKRPGILVFHGGNGKAEEAAAIGWARQGFVALTPELPGWIAENEIKGTSRFQGKEYGMNRFAVTPGVRSCAVFDSISAGLGAFNLLEQMPDVDASRLGVTGISWGGYLTTLLCGYLDRRVKAAFSLYGCGCYDAGTVFAEALNRLPEDEKRVWLKHYDAGNHSDRITASFLFYAAANDSFFYPPSIAATLNRMQEARKYVCFAPNCDHQFDLPGGTGLQTSGDSVFTESEPAFFRHMLEKESGTLPEIIRIEGDAKAREHEVIFSFLPEGARCWAYYCADTAEHWKSKEWNPMEVVRQSNRSCLFRLPELAQAYDWFAGTTFPLATAGSVSPMNIGTTVQHAEIRDVEINCPGV